MALANMEFTVADTYHYDRRGPLRWVASHLWRHRLFLISFLLAMVGANLLNSLVPTVIGQAFGEVTRPHPDRGRLLGFALALLGIVALRSLCDLTRGFSNEVLGKRVERDARDELYLGLLGKSQTFHNRQRVGDLMARAVNDVNQLTDMIVPGFDLLLDSLLSLVVPIIFIAFLNPQLLLSPLLFTVAFVVALRHFVRRLNPVAGAMRAQFGETNAGLAETIEGIEVVKSSAQEEQETVRFTRNTRRYRDLYIESGQIQARYLPPLFIAVALAGAFIHGTILVTHHQLGVGSLISYMGLMTLLRFPTFISTFSFVLLQFGLAASARIISVLEEESDLDENERGHTGTIRGEVVFDHVTFSYGGTPVLQDLSLRIAPGETVALVGQTGTGKSTLTKLVNRIYDVQSGRVLVDGVDVRDWSLDALRSQVSTIEQDIFLFSRSVAENIAFSRGGAVERSAVEQAAHDAQAHDFIMHFQDGYETVIGERGVTLSGGQRQRLAIARALLTDPRILIVDDSTSAIDSATEDEIQKAIRRLLEGRTTLLITHRLSQIRWADKIVVLERGEVVDVGRHDELLDRCALYRRIFAPYQAIDSAAVATH